MTTNDLVKPRPYWHVDAKWVTGILLLFLLSATALTFILAQVTDEEQGIEILTLVIANSFSREGLDQEADIQIMREEIAESPDGSWEPIPGLNISVREEDIEGRSPREIRLWFFRQLAEPIYYGGQQGLSELATDPELRQNMEGGVGPLGFISAETHQRLNRILIILSLVSLAFLGLLIYFSYRFGRLASPGCVIFIVSLPGVAAFSMMRGWVEQAGRSQSPGLEAEETGLSQYAQVIQQLAADVLPGIIRTGLQTYLALALIGIGLLVGAIVGAVVFSRRKSAKSSS